MSLNWRPAPSIPCSVGTSDPFINSLYEFLKYLEANNPITRRYLHVVGSNLTIGIGFDLAAGGPDVIRAVFTQLGLDYDYPENHTNANRVRLKLLKVITLGDLELQFKVGIYPIGRSGTLMKIVTLQC